MKIFPTLPITERMVRKMSLTRRVHSDERRTGEMLSRCVWCLPCFAMMAKGVIMNGIASLS